MKTGKVVFMIDDDSEDHEFFSDALKAIHPSITCMNFFNGEVALKKLSEPNAKLPDIIFTDCNMPIMNGYEFLSEVKHDEHLKHIPVILYTTSSAKEQQEEAIKLGASSVFIKPSSMAELRKKLEVILKENP